MSCEGCAYAVLLSGEWYCDYLLTTGHRRPCPPGEGCTVRVEEKKDPKQTWKECPPVKGRTWDTEKARALYEQGYTDARIAAEVGATGTAVGFWRRKLGLPSQLARGGETPAESPAQIESTVLPENGGVELRVKADGCVISLWAPDLEKAAAIYACAGGLLKDMRRAAGKLKEGMENA